MVHFALTSVRWPPHVRASARKVNTFQVGVFFYIHVFHCVRTFNGIGVRAASALNGQLLP